MTFNVDDPENGLEAMAQVITCEDIIGWRSRSGQGADRGLIRVILYITDDHFHYAGEGQVSINWTCRSKLCMYVVAYFSKCILTAYFLCSALDPKHM